MPITTTYLTPQLLHITITDDLSADDLEGLHEALRRFVTQQPSEGACGLLIDMGTARSISFEALDRVLDVLAEPDDLLAGVRMRVALIGVKGFTQRFLREALPITDMPQVRARFFHEVAQDEAQAWIESLPDAPVEHGLPPSPEKDDDEGRSLFGRLPFGRKR